MPAFEPCLVSFLATSSSARKSFGGRKGLSSSSTEATDAGATMAGVTAPELEGALDVLLLTILPPLLPVVGVHDKLAKWPPRPLPAPGGGPEDRGEGPYEGFRGSGRGG